MSEKIRVSAVSYLNTIPFIFGIDNSQLKDEIILSLDYPSICAQKLISEEVDLGLIPVAAIPHLKYYEIISDYCIGADGPVKTVMLYSNEPLERIKFVKLDYQSRTSVNLVKVLAKFYWNINPVWEQAQLGFEDEIKGGTAGVVIGDRAFELNNKFEFVYDLALEWKAFTHLPFVFACWVANKKLPADFIDKFNSALSFGINNIDKVLHNRKDHSKISNELLELYFKQNISFQLNDAKIKGLNLFLDYLKRI